MALVMDWDIALMSTQNMSEEEKQQQNFSEEEKIHQNKVSCIPNSNLVDSLQKKIIAFQEDKTSEPFLKQFSPPPESLSQTFTIFLSHSIGSIPITL